MGDLEKRAEEPALHIFILKINGTYKVYSCKTPDYKMLASEEYRILGELKVEDEKKEGGAIDDALKIAAELEARKEEEINIHTRLYHLSRILTHKS